MINGTDSLIFGCSVIDANPTVTKYAWYKTGNPKPIETKRNISFSDVSVSDDGTYFCQAENTVGPSNSSVITVDVLCKYFFYLLFAKEL